MIHKLRIGALLIISLCTVFAIIVSGCIDRSSKDHAKFTPDSLTAETAHVTATAATLAWDAPSTYTDGSPLLDIKEYRVYFGASPNPYPYGSVYPVSVPTTSVRVIDVISQGTGTYYFVITAVDSTNRESNPSNEVSRYLY
jgi:hypothetical protein